jgi:hypothetical protein
MHEGYLFFALMWLGCWYFIFISDETIEVRRWGLIRQLGGICFAGLSVQVFIFNINLLIIAGILWSVYQWRNWTNKELFRGAVAIICITIALICIRIFAILYPVWFIVNWIFIAAPLLVGLGISLIHANKRVSVLNCGIILGEAIYSAILYSYGFPTRDIVSFESLDLLLLTLMIAIVIDKAQIIWAGRIPKKKIFHQQNLGLKGKGIR